MLRPYQIELKSSTAIAFDQGHKFLLVVSFVGSGKTFTFTHIAGEKLDEGKRVAILVHRQELLSQASMTAARCGLKHRLIAPSAVIRYCIAQQIKKLGKSFITTDENAPLSIGSVQTITARKDKLTQWFWSIDYWIADEAHHYLADNQFGKTVALFPKARGIGFTATPIRGDKRSLHREQGGVFDHMILGPSPRWLIENGFLTKYRIYAPPPSVDRSKIKVSEATGDFNQDSLRKEAHKSEIVGDAVEHYKKFTPGMQAVVFTVDVEHAQEIAKAFNDAGIPAEYISAKSSDKERQDTLDRFASGQTRVVANCDILGEGFDMPAVEVVIMARPTKSLGLYIQQFGRCLRTAPGKLYGYVIDMVGNVSEHLFPDDERDWQLWKDENRRKKSDEGKIPVKVCTECFTPYEAFHTACPYCGAAPVPEGRSKPEQVDGDLILFDDELIAQLRAERAKVDTDSPPIPYGASDAMRAGILRRHREKQVAQEILRHNIQMWAGWRSQVHGESDRNIQRRFFHTFGCDILTAQGLNRAEAEKLNERVVDNMPL